MVTAAVTVPYADAQTIANGLRRTKVLGVLGEEEQISGLTLKYRPLLRIDFEEQVQRSLLRRALGPSHDRVRGSVYLHVVDLRYLELSASAGISFVAEPDDYASRIDDLDGVAHWLELRPAEMALDEEMWRRRTGQKEACEHFSSALWPN